MSSQDPQEFGVCQCEQEIVRKREKGKAVGRKGIFLHYQGLPSALWFCNK